jgi:hypothetical protein
MYRVLESAKDCPAAAGYPAFPLKNGIFDQQPFLKFYTTPVPFSSSENPLFDIHTGIC